VAWQWIWIGVLFSLPVLIRGAGLLVVLMVRPLMTGRHRGLEEGQRRDEGTSAGPANPPTSPRR